MIKFLRVGKIIKAQGIKGEAKVFPTTSDVKRYDKLKKVYLVKDDDNTKDLSNQKMYDISYVKYLKDAVIVKFDGIDKIEDITHFIGYSLYIDRDDAITLDKNEYFLPDLINMDVKSVDDKLCGKLVDVIESKKSSCMVVKTDKKEYLIPMAVDYIDKIDFSKNLITIKLIEGILDI